MLDIFALFVVLFSMFAVWKAIQFRNKGNFAVYDKDYRNVWTPRKRATDAIRWISSENPAKISHKSKYKGITGNPA